MFWGFSTNARLDGRLGNTAVVPVSNSKNGYIEHGKYISNFTTGLTLRVAHVCGPYSGKNIKKSHFHGLQGDFCSLYNRAITRHFSSHPRTWRDMRSALSLSACLSWSSKSRGIMCNKHRKNCECWPGLWPVVGLPFLPGARLPVIFERHWTNQQLNNLL